MCVCNDRYSLSPDHVARVREFMERFEEERAWKGSLQARPEVDCSTHTAT